jgi:hypothetical protein
MATTTYIKRKNQKNLDGNTMKIVKVYNFYRDGGLEVRQADGSMKYVGKTFVNCPKRIKDNIVIQGDEQLKYIEGDEMEFREVVWNKELKARTFVKYAGKFDKDFYATYKKVYDIEVIVKDEFTNPVWDKDANAEVLKTFEGGVSATLNSFPVGRLKNLLESLELDTGIEKIKGKDKAGNEAMVMPYDWEDNVKNKLEGKFFSMRVRGEGLDTKYSFKEAPEFVIMNEAQNVFEDDTQDLPF